jgi:hypothetical protein
MMRQLNERERISTTSQLRHSHAAAECSGRKAGLHITEGRWGRDRFGSSQARVYVLVAIQRDAVAGKQMWPKPRLTLAEQLKIELPDIFD